MNLLPEAILAAMFFAGTLHIAEAAEQFRPLQTQSPGKFQVKVTKGELSLEASQAPLAQVLEEIGKQAKITIDSNIGPEEKITTSLNRVPIEDGINQLAKNVTVFYAQGPNDKTRRIERVVVLSERKEITPAPAPAKGSSQAEKRSAPSPEPAKANKRSQPEPFKFELDPRKFGEKQKPGKQP